VSLAADPRVDPRIPAALAPFGLDGLAPPPPVSADSPRDAQLEFLVAAEGGFEAVFHALMTGLPAVEGVTHESLSIPRQVRDSAGDGAGTGAVAGEIPLTIHRPAGTSGPLPAVVHLHGGGMTLLTAEDPVYVYERDELAACGLIVIGVEFRNAGGKLGAHSYPAGLDDCADAVRWALSEGDALGASGVVVSGESGGGNLTLAISHRARREGWLDQVAGFYAQCPFIHGGWTKGVDELPSMSENDNYLVGCALFAVLAEVYDPGSSHAGDPECWPLRASLEDLRGMPPHVISVNELDPLRDEGLQYYRALVRAGVSTTGRMVAGTCHGGDILFPAAIPEVHAASIRDVAAFAHDAVAAPSAISR
jgi:acetyl esterase